MTQGVVMLKKEIKIIVFFLLIFFQFCNSNLNQDDLEEKIKNKSIFKSDRKEYIAIYNDITDSVSIWTLNQLGLYTFKKGEFSFKIDSLIATNNSINRLITCIHSYTEQKEGHSDGLIYFYGEKINNNWFFFRGGAIVIPRSMVPNQPINTPLSYQQLHEIALKEVYSNYLLPNGEINEAWFTSHFEGPGWGDFHHQEYDDWCFNGKRYTNIKDYYTACHLCKVKSNWAKRDTTKPIIQLSENKIP